MQEATPGTKRCPECKMEIPAGAHRCAYCRRSLLTPRNLLIAVLALTWLIYSGFFRDLGKVQKSFEQVDAALDQTIKSSTDLQKDLQHQLDVLNQK